MSDTEHATVSKREKDGRKDEGQVQGWADGRTDGGWLAGMGDGWIGGWGMERRVMVGWLDGMLWEKG